MEQRNELKLIHLYLTYQESKLFLQCQRLLCIPHPVGLQWHWEQTEMIQFSSPQMRCKLLYALIHASTHKTLVNGLLSDSSMVTCGIPQGSIIGPLLFLLYINDLPNSNLVSKVRMYADDTRLTYVPSSPGDLSHSMNHALTSVQEWLNANKRSLNTTRTKCMFPGTRSNLDEIAHSPGISINGCPIERVKSYKCLRCLCWWTSNMGFPHWQQENKKIARGLGVLRRIKPFVPADVLLCIFNSLILPHLDYCSSVWGSIVKGLSAKIQKLQNRAARIITGPSYDIRSTDILRQLGWKNMAKRRLNQLQ